MYEYVYRASSLHACIYLLLLYTHRAEERYRDGLKVWLHNHGLYHQCVADSYYNLGCVLSDMHHWIEAKKEVCVYVYLHVWYTYVYMYVCICMYICMCVHMYVYMYVCMYSIRIHRRLG